MGAHLAAEKCGGAGAAARVGQTVAAVDQRVAVMDESRERERVCVKQREIVGECICDERSEPLNACHLNKAACDCPFLFSAFFFFFFLHLYLIKH